MPASRDDAPAGLLSRLAAGALRYAAGRLDALAPEPVVPGPAASRTDSEATGGARADCAPGMGCGGAAASLGGVGPAYAAITPSLDRPTIDDLCSDALMWRIVTMLVEDSMSATPTLAGELGELTPCIDWLNERGFWPEAKRAMTYARQYGGGGILCIVDDGRKSDQEIDLFSLRDVVGFYALPKWYLVPDGVGSARVSAAWYGQRIGRPEHYYATPVTGLGSSVSQNIVARGAGPVGSGLLPEDGAGAGARVFSPRDLNRLLDKSGRRFHRSRVIAWPYRDEMDLRLARWFPQWNGWGPGIVEAVLAPFLAYRGSALRISSIMRSLVVNTVEISDLEGRQSTPDAGAALRNFLDLVKACRDYTDDSVPLIATEPGRKFDSLTHNVAGIDKLLAALRQYMLDVVEYPSVKLFGDTAGGMSGGGREGELKAYGQTVSSTRSSWVWSAGSFGGGLRQAVLLSMACERGPTDGQMDRTVTATWPEFVTETAEEAANTRLKEAQARAQDALTLNLTADALLRHDPTVKRRYPSLDVDEGPLPQPAQAVAGSQVVPGVTPAQVDPSTSAETATTPGATNTALAEQQASGGDQPADAAPPATLPADIHTEAEIAAAMKMTRAALSRLLADAGVQPVIPAAKGQRGGARYSLGQVLAAWQAQAKGRADAMRAGERG